MRIEHYSFGKIVIDGKTYTSDVIVYPGRVDASWRRKEGHSLQAVDLADIIRAKPGLLIVGTGYSGVMTVPEETVGFVGSKGIELRVERTEKAVDIYNSTKKDRTVIAALHLTC
ncbi:MAG: MTH938/NDUFAF3 family protein [Nitrospirae bacterium]|nr:MTH938/NDUFAF3 family protein [Nitrospirota bacterium]